MNDLEIEKVVGREILDSRGNPTVEAEVTLIDGTIGRGMASSVLPLNTLSSYVFAKESSNDLHKEVSCI